jgi:hypothetical protein
VVEDGNETAVHVSVPARLVTQQPAYPVDPLGRRRDLAALSHVRTRDLTDVTDNDPEWFTAVW